MDFRYYSHPIRSAFSDVQLSAVRYINFMSLSGADGTVRHSGIARWAGRKSEKWAGIGWERGGGMGRRKEQETKE